MKKDDFGLIKDPKSPLLPFGMKMKRNLEISANLQNQP
jgi:hypothetical protein